MLVDVFKVYPCRVHSRTWQKVSSIARARGHHWPQALYSSGSRMLLGVIKMIQIGIVDRSFPRTTVSPGVWQHKARACKVFVERLQSNLACTRSSRAPVLYRPQRWKSGIRPYGKEDAGSVVSYWILRCVSDEISRPFWRHQDAQTCLLVSR